MLFVFANQSGPRDALVSFFQQVSQYIGDVIVWMGMGPVMAALAGGLALGFLIGLPCAFAWAFDISRQVWFFFGTATLPAYTPSECLAPTIIPLIGWLLFSIFIINSSPALAGGVGVFLGYLLVWALAWVVKSLPKKRKGA